jgi:hypothetical protein
VYGDPDIKTENMTKDRYAVARSLGFRSGLEVSVARDLDARGVKYEFEKVKVKYTKPVKEQTYTPDFSLDNGVIIETKGRFTTEDRQKMRCVKDQNPTLDIRILFANARNRINKGSPTTYAMWADKNGYKWAERVVPQEWIDAPKRN